MHGARLQITIAQDVQDVDRTISSPHREWVSRERRLSSTDVGGIRGRV